MSTTDDKEDKKSTCNIALLERTEQSSTKEGSNQNSVEWKPPKEKPKEFRTSSKREGNVTSPKIPEYVCFIGKFPKAATLADIQNFVKSKGINYTAVRVGPKKKPNANVFGYVDLPTKEDYDKLLALNRSSYRGRRIRVDHATPKIPSPHRKMKQNRRVIQNQVVDYDSAEENKPIPPYDRQLMLKLIKLHAALLAKTEPQVNPMIDTTMFVQEPTVQPARIETTQKKKPGRIGANKQTARSKRYALERSQNRNRRKEQNYRSSAKKNAGQGYTGKDSSGNFLAGRGGTKRFNTSKVGGLHTSSQVASIAKSFEE
jgi:hypothetical protein